MQTEERFLTTQQSAERLGLSVSTVKRLVESNELPAIKTPGGHRRITESSLIQFAGSKGLQLNDQPTSADTGSNSKLLLSSTGQFEATHDSLDYWKTALKSALLRSSFEDARHAIRTVYAAEGEAARLGDNLISPVMNRIGHAWQDGRIEIFQEHHACHLLEDILYELVRHARSRNRRSGAEPTAPLAIGATPEGDHYTLTGMLCELCLLERGWNVRNLGCHLPLIELSQAITDLKPKIVWLSVHFLKDEPGFLTDCRRLFETARAMKAELIIGGRGLSKKVKEELTQNGVKIADNLYRLAEVSDSVYPEGRRAIGGSGNAHQDLHKSR